MVTTTLIFLKVVLCYNESINNKQKLMKKFLMMMAILVLPLGVSAAVFGSGEKEYVVKPQTVINDDLYVAVHSVIVNGDVNGDAIAAASNISIDGDVSGDAMIFGQKVQINNVGDDLRAAGDEVFVNGRIEDDAIIAGRIVFFASDSEVGGDVHAVGESVVIDGVITGDVWVRAENVTINGVIAGDVNINSKNPIVMGDTSQVAGDFVYSSSMPTVSESSVSGDVVYAENVHKSAQGHNNYFAQFVWLLIKVVTWSIVIILLLSVFAKQFATATKNVVAAPAINIAWGLGTVIFVPFAIIVLLVSIIAAPLGLIAIVLFGILMFVTKVTSFVVVGAILNKWATKSKKYEFNWKTATIGVVSVIVIGAIPVIGWIAKVLLCLTVLGAIIAGIVSRKK